MRTFNGWTFFNGRIEVKDFRYLNTRGWGHRVPTVLHNHAFDLGPFTVFWGRRFDK